MNQVYNCSLIYIVNKVAGAIFVHVNLSRDNIMNWYSVASSDSIIH